MQYPFDCISEFIFAETGVRKSDVILIPGASHSQLMERAAELYHRGFARYVLPSGGANRKLTDHESEWDYLRDIGIQLGVLQEAILREDKARNTFENAQFSWDVLRTLSVPVKDVILVCKAYHSRRALLTYRSVFPLDIHFCVSPVVDNRGISKANWFLDEDSISIVMDEVVKIGTYFRDEIPKWI